MLYALGAVSQEVADIVGSLCTEDKSITIALLTSASHSSGALSSYFPLFRVVIAARRELRRRAEVEVE